MKYTRIATAMIASAMTTSVFASNWVSVQTPMTAYVAAGLTAEVTQELVFPDIVKPVNAAAANSASTAAISASESVTVTPDGNVAYTGDSAPGGGAGSQESENAEGNTDLGVRSAQAGELQIVGEPGYAISVTITPDSTVSGNIPTGMAFNAVFDNNGTTSSTTDAQLDGTGNLTLGFGGKLSVDHNFGLTPGVETTIQLTALINYRS